MPTIYALMLEELELAAAAESAAEGEEAEGERARLTAAELEAGVAGMRALRLMVSRRRSRARSGDCSRNWSSSGSNAGYRRAT